LNCKFALKENPKTRSVYCGKFDQWVSVKYCNLCLNHEPLSAKLINNNKIIPIHNYSYNYNNETSTIIGREARGFSHTSLKFFYCFFGGFL